MAKSSKSAVEATIKAPAKSPKSKLNFTAGEPIDKKEAVIKNEPAADKEITAASVESVTIPDVSVIDNAILPVEELSSTLSPGVISTTDNKTPELKKEEVPTKTVGNTLSENKPYKANNKPYNKDGFKEGFKSNKELPPASGLYPEHMVEISLIIKHNAEIRRFTALGILNYLQQKGEIRGKSKYVTFKWNKFTVKVDNLIKDYSFAEPFFLNCLVAAFSSFSASAQRTINNFTMKELNKNWENVVTQDGIDNAIIL